MDKSDILALYDRELRIEITYPAAVREVTPHVIRSMNALPRKSYIVYSDLDESNADAVIAEQIAYFTERGLPFEWIAYGHDQPSDLINRLVAHGLESEDPGAIMVLDLAATPPALLEPVTALIRRLSDPADLADVVAVLDSVWDDDFSWVHARLGQEMTIPDFLSIYVAYVEDRPASVAWVYFPEGHFATLWAGSTVASMRGRGLYTALLATRIQEAIARGKRFVTLVAGPMSKPIVARHGFWQLTTAADYEPPSVADNGSGSG